MDKAEPRRVLVLGAYGLIGSEIVREMRKAGMECRGVVRSRETAARLAPGLACIEADISRLTEPAHWLALVEGCDAVVNASGALQSGARDNLSAVQERAITALVAACEEAGVKTFVQISAPGAEPDADTAFMRTKARADRALRASALDWIIFKPGLVVSRNAYGGTALIRMLAGAPLILPLTLADARIQTVCIGDVAQAVVLALKGDVPMRRDFDLVEDEAHALGEIVAKFRMAMGLEPAWKTIMVPKAIGYAIAKGADLAGWLGWRSPLRTTALKVLERDVEGDPGPWRAATGRALASLDETLARHAGALQDRVFARAMLFYPLAIITLAIFFILSGAIALFQLDDAAAMLAPRLGEGMAKAMTIAFSLVDIALGAAILVRRWTLRAAAGMALLCLIYLTGGSLLTPALWSDPLGAFVKILPAFMLSLGVVLLTQER